MNLERQVNNLPEKAGVYFFKNKTGKILYIGKAANLKKRLAQYFQKIIGSKFSRMLEEASKIDFIETDSEISALLLESEMIKRYKPSYNERWKDEKNFLYLKITTTEDFPRLYLVRFPLDDKNKYFGPFTDAGALKKSLKILRKIFPFRTASSFPHPVCLWGHLKRCPCFGISKEDYKKIIKKIILFFSGQQEKVKKELEGEMEKASEKRDFERAASLRDELQNLEKLNEMTVFGQEESLKIKLDQALLELYKKLELSHLPYKIECYDISNLFGQEAVGSLVIFKDGLPAKDEYRKFRIKMVKKIDDYAMMKEVLRRRLGHREEVLPDLIIIDGGKGQVNAALGVLSESKLDIPVIGLAKKREEIYKRRGPSPKLRANFEKIILAKDSAALYLVQRIRDEAHRFAIIYHRLLREKKAKKSLLDEIPGLGPVRKKILLRSLGSVKKIKETKIEKLAKLIGPKLASKIKENL